VSISSHSEKIISGIGAFIAVYTIYTVSHMVLGDDALLLVVSMGAATVLLFAVPHGPLSQPWPLFGGNLISAVIGVGCAQWIPDTFIAASAAMGLSVMAMYYLGCTHPPGGATALTAVVGGSSVHELGLMYVITPVLLNVLIIFVVALIFNAPFKWRRYPARLTEKLALTKGTDQLVGLSHQGITFAMQEMDSFIDVSEDDLKKIFQLAKSYDDKQEAISETK
jgi:CBS domain-containing membrane protein